ncbi:hypothetical protein Slin14017_G063270 [Septoria linicola]|nr:hypothetical protein Slin14017_G063270 [Septoria linicola]
MSIQWHHDNHPTIASKIVNAQSSGGLQVRAHGRGQYLFYVDHNPHFNNQLTHFAPNTAPIVHAYSRDGRRLAQISVRRDRFGDKNACVWNGSGNPMTAYFVVQWQLHPMSIRACRHGTGFVAQVKLVRM